MKIVLGCDYATKGMVNRFNSLLILIDLNGRATVLRFAADCEEKLRLETANPFQDWIFLSETSLLR